ncbi:MAG: serine/threonine-protein kinase [Candidatus Eremiobacterota bacterium]
MNNSLQEGTVLQEKYEIHKCISSREFCNIYKGYDRINKKEIIIKELQNRAIDSSYKEEAIKKLSEEVEIYRHIKHKHMASVIDHFSDTSAICTENRQFIVMEYIEGKTLRQIKEERNISIEEISLWIEQICNVFIFMSRINPGLLFYYLSPDHIMITEEKNVKLINYGLIRTFRKGPYKNNRYMGIAGYSAPEQYGIKDIDTRADIFALGTIIYYLLTGDDPAKHPLNFSPVRNFNSSVSMQFARFVSRCIHVNPEERFVNFLDLKETFKTILLMDTQITIEIAKKKELPEEHWKVKSCTTAGKEVKSWKEEFIWTVNRYTGIRYAAAIIAVILILATGFLYKNTSSVQKSAYLLEYNGNSIAVMNTVNGEITGKIETGLTSGGIAVSPDGKYLYVTRTGNRLSVIDIKQEKEINNIIVKDEPVGVKLSRKGDKIFVVNRKGNSITVIDRESQMLLAHIPAGKEPVDAVIAGEELYVCNYSSNDVSVIDINSNKSVKNIPVERRPVAIAFNSVVQKLYVANSASETVSVIDIKTKKIISTITTPGFARDISVYPDEKLVCVVIPETKSILLIDPLQDRITGELIIKKNVASINFSSDGKYFYICSPAMAENQNSEIIVYDTMSKIRVKEITLKNQCIKMVFTPLIRESSVAIGGF